MKELIVRNWDGYNQAGMEKITAEIFADIDKTVWVEYPHHHTREPKENDKINIFFWSSPVSSEKATPSAIFGHNVTCTDTSFASSGYGTPITNNGYAVAEVVGWNIFIHYDILHTTRDNEALAIYKEILTRAKKLLGSKSINVVRILNSVSKERLAIDKRRHEDSLKRIRSDIKNYEGCIEASKQDIVASEKRLVELKNKKTKDWKKEIALIKKHPAITEVGFEIGALRLKTVPLVTYELDDKTKRLIGEVEIKIPLQSRMYDYPEMLLVKRQERGATLPHQTRSSGEMCYGNMAEQVMLLIQAEEIVILVDLLIEFIKTPNTEDSAGANAYDFPLEDGSYPERPEEEEDDLCQCETCRRTRGELPTPEAFAADAPTFQPPQQYATPGTWTVGTTGTGTTTVRVENIFHTTFHTEEDE